MAESEFISNNKAKSSLLHSSNEIKVNLLVEGNLSGQKRMFLVEVDTRICAPRYLPSLKSNQLLRILLNDVPLDRDAFRLEGTKNNSYFTHIWPGVVISESNFLAQLEAIKSLEKLLINKGIPEEEIDELLS